MLISILEEDFVGLFFFSVLVNECKYCNSKTNENEATLHHIVCGGNNKLLKKKTCEAKATEGRTDDEYVLEEKNEYKNENGSANAADYVSCHRCVEELKRAEEVSDNSPCVYVTKQETASATKAHDYEVVCATGDKQTEKSANNRNECGDLNIFGNGKCTCILHNEGCKEHVTKNCSSCGDCNVESHLKELVTLE